MAPPSVILTYLSEPFIVFFTFQIFPCKIIGDSYT